MKEQQEGLKAWQQKFGIGARERSNREVTAEEVSMTGVEHIQEEVAKVVASGTKGNYEIKRGERKLEEPSLSVDEGDRSEEERWKRKQKEKKHIFISFLIDGSFSFSKIFVAIYYALKHMFGEIEDKIGNSADYKVHYGLTVLHDEPENIQFSDGYFTTDKNEMLGKIRNIVFKGGSTDGYEDLHAGISECLRNLADNTAEFNSRGLVFITDSCPKEELLDFTELDVKYNNLRFVLGYHHESEQRDWLFNIVDGAGKPVQLGKNEASFLKITELLDAQRESSITRCITSLKLVLSVTSID